MVIDSHCHLIDPKYTKSTKQLIKEAQEEGVQKFITIGTSLENNIEAKNLAQEYADVYYSVAIYPHENQEKDISQIIEELEQKFLIGKDNKLIAIGECGIDITNRPEGRDLELQKILFEDQVKLAIKYDLPVIVHNRNGDTYVLEVLTKYVPLGLKGVIHCFDSNWSFAEKILNLGFYISFSGMITYNNKKELVEVATNVPLDRFLVETDAPYLTPKKYKGEINCPLYVKEVINKISEIKGLSIEEVEKASAKNTIKLFSLTDTLV